MWWRIRVCSDFYEIRITSRVTVARGYVRTYSSNGTLGATAVSVTVTAVRA